ncbi:hypothetical protein BC941DRAFT_426746 [Chlamydoabsidia padenii]|nr:hypothetical protein BC941DRAFT_426746 [Chlamydoabsidia padenii]
MSSSSLTSVSINKNKSRFAPKVKARPPKRPQNNDSSTSQASATTEGEASGTSKIGVDINLESDNIKETLRHLSSSTLPDVTNTPDLISANNALVENVMESINTTRQEKASQPPLIPSIGSSSSNKKSKARRTSTAGIPIVPGSAATSSSSNTTTTTNNNSTNSKKKTRRTVPMVIPEPSTPGTPGTPGTPHSPTTPLPYSYSDDGDDVPVESVSEPITSPSSPPPPTLLDASIRRSRIRASKATSSSGNSFAAPSNIDPSTTPIQKKEELDENYDQLNEFESADDDDEINGATERVFALAQGRIGQRRKQKGNSEGSKKRSRISKEPPLLAKDMKTLNDIDTDPLPPDNLDQNMVYFIQDRPSGIVTKQFRDEQIQLEQERLQREEELAVKDNDQDTLGRLAQQKLELQQRKELDDALLAKKTEEEKQKKRQQQQQNQGGLTESSHALQVRMIDGKIVLDTDSMQIDRQQDQDKVSHEHMEVVEENSRSRKVNSHTYMKNRGNARWSSTETDLFYELLSQFGTDFEMMSQLVPNRSRNQIRLKYSKELKINAKKVNDYMVHKRKPLDIESFKKMTGLEFEKVPDDFHTIKST